MTGPMAAGPERPRSATSASTAARICPSSTCAGRYSARIRPRDSSFGGQLLAARRCGTVGRLLALLDRLADEGDEPGLVHLAALRRMRSFLISVRSIRRVPSRSFSPAFMAAFTSASMRCCGVVVVMAGL